MVEPSTSFSPEAASRVARVVARLKKEGGADGFVPFDQFMEVALYDRDAGFYARERTPLGSSGDFYTAPHVHPLFGRTLAERVRTVRRALEFIDAGVVRSDDFVDGECSLSELPMLLSAVLTMVTSSWTTP
jgi:hypothetical protein